MFKCTLCNTDFERSKLFLEHMKVAHGFAEAGGLSSSIDEDETDGDIEDVAEVVETRTDAAAAADAPESEDEDDPEAMFSQDVFDPAKDDYDVRA